MNERGIESEEELSVEGDLGRSDAPLYSKTYTILAVALLTVLTILHGVDRVLIGVMAEPIKLDLGLSDGQMGFLAGLVFAGAYTLFTVPLAHLGERVGRNVVLGFAAVWWSFATMISGAVTSFFQMCIVRALVGIGESPAVPLSHSLIGDYVSGKYRSRALSFIGAGTSLGTMIGFIFGGVGAAVLGWRMTFAVAGAVGILFGLICILVLKEPRRDKTVQRQAVPPLWSTLRHLLRNRKFVMLLVISVFCMTGAMSIVTWSTSYVVRLYQVPISEAGTWLGFAKGLSGAVGVLLGGVLSISAIDGPRGLRNPAVTLFFGGLAYVGAFLGISWEVTLVGILIGSLLSNTWYAAVFTGLQSIVSDSERGQAVAVLLMANSVLGAGLGPLLVGMLSDILAPTHSNSLQIPLLVFGAGAMIIAGLLLFYMSLDRQVSDHLRIQNERNPAQLP